MGAFLLKEFAMQKYIKLRKQIHDNLNLDRGFTRVEKKYIKIWTTKYNYDFDIISFALHYTSNKRDPNFAYIHCLLSDWYHKGFITKEDILQWLDLMKKKYNR